MTSGINGTLNSIAASLRGVVTKISSLLNQLIGKVKNFANEHFHYFSSSVPKNSENNDRKFPTGTEETQAEVSIPLVVLASNPEAEISAESVDGLIVDGLITDVYVSCVRGSLDAMYQNSLKRTIEASQEEIEEIKKLNDEPKVVVISGSDNYQPLSPLLITDRPGVEIAQSRSFSPLLEYRNRQVQILLSRQNQQLATQRSTSNRVEELADEVVTTASQSGRVVTALKYGLVAGVLGTIVYKIVKENSAQVEVLLRQILSPENLKTVVDFVKTMDGKMLEISETSMAAGIASLQKLKLGTKELTALMAQYKPAVTSALNKVLGSVPTAAQVEGFSESIVAGILSKAPDMSGIKSALAKALDSVPTTAQMNTFFEGLGKNFPVQVISNFTSKGVDLTPVVSRLANSAKPYASSASASASALYRQGQSATGENLILAGAGTVLATSFLFKAAMNAGVGRVDASLSGIGGQSQLGRRPAETVTSEPAQPTLSVGSGPNKTDMFK